MLWFIGAFFVFEVLVLSLKGIIYLTGKEWVGVSIWQIMFLILHALRVIFPLTLQVRFYKQIKLYQALVSNNLSDRSKLLTKVFATVVHVIMSLAAIWYNFLI